MSPMWFPQRIYFDTESLRGRNWPRLPNDLLLFFAGAANYKLPCLFPAPVLCELEENWKREVAEDKTAARQIKVRYDAGCAIYFFLRSGFPREECDRGADAFRSSSESLAKADM